MILADKIMNLRKQRGWSQEELAEKMGVSRQSVSKWEAAQSIPDIEKIIKMGEVFEVSVDYLVKDEIEEDTSTDIKDEPELQIRTISAEEANTYMDLVKGAARKIAYGVMAIIIAIIPLLILGGLSETGAIIEDTAAGIGVGVLLAVIAISVAVFIITGMKLSPYEFLEKEEIKLLYGVEGIVAKKKDEFAGTHRALIAIGVVLCIVGIIPLIVVGAMGASDLTCIYMISIMFLFIAIAVYLFIWSGMIMDSYNKLLQVGEYTLERKHANKKYGPFATIYWCSVTAIYLFISFFFNNWDTSWIVWPVAGVAFGAVMGTIALLGNKEK